MKLKKYLRTQKDNIYEILEMSEMAHCQVEKGRSFEDLILFCLLHYCGIVVTKSYSSIFLQ